MYPETINQLSDNVITVKWDDEHESIYFADHLRKNCPCALCEQERSSAQDQPFKILKTRTDDVHFSGWKMVGRYAVSFTFSDNHKTGIYPFEVLRSLCQCDLCADDVIRIQGPLR